MTLGTILNKSFGKIYIKNLEESVERKALIEESFDKAGLKYTVQKAFNGLEFVGPTFQFQHNSHIITYPASAGFFGGQISTIRTILAEIEKKSDAHILCDDDCFVRDISMLSAKTLKTINLNLPADWDIVILGDLNYDGPIDNLEEFTYRRCMRNWTETAGSHAIAVRSSVYRHFLVRLMEMKFWGDRCVGQLLEEGRNVYKLTPSLIFQDRNMYSVMNRTNHNNYLISRNV